jgi:hypothetical protein
MPEVEIKTEENDRNKDVKKIKKQRDISKTIKSLLVDFLLIDKMQTYQIEGANIIATIFSRSILIILGIYFIYFISCTQGAKYYGLLTFTFVIVIETLYICIKRKGIDFKW